MDRKKPFIDEGQRNFEQTDQVPAWLSMYQIPGNPPINRHSLENYIHDRERDQESIQSQFQDSHYFTKFWDAGSDERASLLEQGINSDDPYVVQACGTLIHRLLLQTDRDRLGHMLLRKITSGIESGNVEAIRAYAESDAIDEIPLQERSHLIRAIFPTTSSEIALLGSALLQRVPRDSIEPLISEALNSENPTVIKPFAKCHYFAPFNSHSALQAKTLEIVTTSFRDGDTEASKSYADLVDSIPEDQRSELVLAGINHSDQEVMLAYAKATRCVPIQERSALENRIWFMAQARLNSDDLGDWKVGIKLIPFSGYGKTELFGIASRKCPKLLIEPSLYPDNLPKDRKIARISQDKTGSETTLLGGSLKGQAIVRVLRPEPFLAWQKLYENNDLWRRSGFDYVPIEPIASFDFDRKKKNVRVFSGVLDLSFGDWKEMTEDYRQALSVDANNIERIAKDNGVRHGHPHYWNYCLRFFRQADSEIDFNRKPRIYLIDFDRARFID